MPYLKELQVGVVIITGLLHSVVSTGDRPCQVSFQSYGWVCVCDSDYCDTIAQPSRLSRGQFHLYYTSESDPGFSHSKGIFSEDTTTYCNEERIIEIDNSVYYQEILGFGGSFTDSTGVVFDLLSEKAQENFIQSYFGLDGIEYTLCRVPIGGTDFSPREYTLDDVPGDENLEHFNLTFEDYHYKIPLIKKALASSNRGVSVCSAAWFSPRWMKTENISGYLKPEYYHSWALYHVKFLQAYRDNGIDIWAISGGNEVYIFHVLDYPTNVTTWMPEDYRLWVKNYLIPEMKKANFSDVKFLALDDVRDLVLYWMNSFEDDPEAYQLVDAVSVHWYFDYFTVPSILNDFHLRYPDKLILYTESSVNSAFMKSDEPVILPGSWRRAELYIYDIIENLNHWVNGYIDWNLALDTSGGPSIGPAVDAAILVNTTSGQFYKQPIFYALGHFSKFMPPGSRRVSVGTNQEVFVEDEMKKKATYNMTAFHDWFWSWFQPDGSIVYPSAVIPPKVHCVATANSDQSSTVILFNPLNEISRIKLTVLNLGCVHLELKPHSIYSLVYWI